MNEVYQYKTGMIGATIKDVDGAKGIVTGYFSKFDNVDADGDIIVKGAFTKTIMENGPQSQQPRIKHLMNHNTSQPLGLLTMLAEDNNGLAYESVTGKHSLGVDFIKMVESGLITEHSIGFKTIKKNQIQGWEDYNKNPSKGRQQLTELKLWEGSSLTSWGANPMTPITGVKGISDMKSLIDRHLQIEKFCKSTDATDETIQLLLIYSKQLTQLIIDSEKITKSDETTLPIADIQNTFKSFIKTLNNG
jgi:HK97 family phage prohead protease